MKKEEALFVVTGQKIKGAEQSQMFGKPCFKVDGKAFACFFNDEMVFKLAGDIHAEAVNLKGAKLFDPSGKGRAMKEWVQVPFAHAARWEHYATQAANYVRKSS